MSYSSEEHSETELPNTTVYIGLQDCRVVKVVSSNPCLLVDVSDATSIDFDKPLKYLVSQPKSVTVIFDNDTKMEYKSVVQRDAMYVTVADRYNNMVTCKYKAMIEGSESLVKVEILDPTDQVNTVSYSNSSITWKPKLVISVDSLTTVSYSASLFNTGSSLEGNYFISTREPASSPYPRALMMEKRAATFTQEVPQVPQESQDKETTYDLGKLAFEGNLVVPIDSKTVKSKRYTIFDIDFYLAGSDSGICTEGLLFDAPFYIPATQASYLEGSFHNSFYTPTRQEGQPFLCRTYKSQKVRYTVTHVGKIITKLRGVLEEIDTKKYDVIEHTYTLVIENTGPKVSGLIAISNVGNIVTTDFTLVTALSKDNQLTHRIKVKPGASTVIMKVYKKERIVKDTQ